jgi:hypothetical protein
MKVSEFSRFRKRPHPTGEREMGRCTDLMSPTLGKRRRGRWCLG